MFASISARVGSIDDNRSGGGTVTGHRKRRTICSSRHCHWKHAENIRDLSVHHFTGTVDTSLSAPYTRRYDPNKLFSPAHSVQCMIEVLGGLSPAEKWWILCLGWPANSLLNESLDLGRRPSKESNRDFAPKDTRLVYPSSIRGNHESL